MRDRTLIREAAFFFDLNACLRIRADRLYAERDAKSSFRAFQGQTDEPLTSSRTKKAAAQFQAASFLRGAVCLAYSVVIEPIRELNASMPWLWQYVERPSMTFMVTIGS